MAGAGTTKVKNVTIRDVAKDAGVSPAAVSKVMRNAYGVSEDLRGKVLKSIEKLNYRPSTAARGMRGRTYSVGLLLVEMRNPFMASVVDGVKTRLRRDKYQTLIGVSDASVSLEHSLIDSMIDLKMDGVILVAPRLPDELLAQYAAQIPLVIIGHHQPDASGFDTVNSDDELGARLAVEAMVAGGRKDIHMVSLPERQGASVVYSTREQGYLAAMRDAGLSDRSRIWRMRERQDLEGLPLETIVEIDPLPQGVFCWSDVHAIELINLARTRGIEVPGDMAIVGYDDTPVAGLPLIGLSSVDQHGDILGETAADLLLSRVGGRGEAQHSLIRPNLIPRGSS